MIENINWTSVSFAALGSIVTTLSVFAGAFFAWGKITERVSEQGERQKDTNGKIDAQVQKDNDLQSEINAVKERCATRDDMWKRNNDDHGEIFARLNSLEKEFSAMPGQFSRTMDEKFKQWRGFVRTDIKATIYEIDKEKGKSS